MKRPILITIIALLAIISGAMQMLASFGIGVSSVFTGLKTADPGSLEGLKGLQLASVIAFVIGLIAFVYGLGMWRLKKWAWWLAVLFNLGVIVSNAYNYSQAVDQAQKTGILIGLAVCVLMLLFLLSGHVRKAFGFGSQD